LNALWKRVSFWRRVIMSGFPYVPSRWLIDMLAFHPMRMSRTAGCLKEVIDRQKVVLDD
jgi:hypothetical protein